MATVTTVLAARRVGHNPAEERRHVPSRTPALAGCQLAGGVPVIERIVSGGQTGVDRAALAVAQELAIPCGGWCPRGRLAEDGRVPDRFPMQETPSQGYGQRTSWNLRDSDGTLVLTRGELRGGTAFTVRIARRLGKPCLVVSLERQADTVLVGAWLDDQRIRVVNVAGPRESQCPGVFEAAGAFLRRLLAAQRQQ